MCAHPGEYCHADHVGTAVIPAAAVIQPQPCSNGEDQGTLSFNLLSAVIKGVAQWGKHFF